MPEHEASRTLVKSPPELWAECSDAASLTRHLGGFGEIRITKLEPETAVAWEGDDVRGTVTLEPSGWGTRVILTAVAEHGAAVELPPVVAVEPPPVVAGQPPPLAAVATVDVAAAAGPVEALPRGFLGRLLARLGRRRPGPDGSTVKLGPPADPVVADAPSLPAAEPRQPSPEGPDDPPSPSAIEDELAVLTRALDSLGMAHHRPYSRG